MTMEYPVEWPDYYPQDVTYGTHSLKWEHIVGPDENLLFLTCSVCLTRIKHPITVKGGGNVIIHCENDMMTQMTYQTLDGFSQIAMPDCHAHLVSKVSNE